MLLTCLGHAKFLIELNSGLRIVTDPFDAACGYPLTETQADVVLVSHGHHDHSAVETISGNPRIIREAGTYTLESGVTVTAIPAFHDEVQGAKRGNTLLFLLAAEGLRIAHLGDLGHLLTAEQRKALAPVDVLMLPVGGFYTIDAATAQEVAESLRARVIVPMHYRTKWNARRRSRFSRPAAAKRGRECRATRPGRSGHHAFHRRSCRRLQASLPRAYSARRCGRRRPRSRRNRY